MKRPKRLKPLPRLRPYRDTVALALDGADCRGWYQSAMRQIVAHAPGLGCSPQRLADLLALFSPRVSVRRSVRWAIHYARTGEYTHDCTRSIRAAVSHYESTGEIRGPKTAPFARALMGDSSALVLDSWMGEALGIDAKRFESVYVHRVASRRVVRVAQFLGWPVAETQAAIWAGTLRRSGRNIPPIDIGAELEDSTPV